MFNVYIFLVFHSVDKINVDRYVDMQYEFILLISKLFSLKL